MKKFNIFKIAIIVACLFSIIGLFLPYEKATDEYKKKLNAYPKEYNIEEVKLTNEDVINVSIIENYKVYSYAMKNSGDDDWMNGEATINVIITIVLIVSIILIILFALLNKSILTIIFSIVMAISSLLMNYDIVDRGVMPSSRYTYGISYYLYIVFAIIILVCSIINIVKNKKSKKVKK